MTDDIVIHAGTIGGSFGGDGCTIKAVKVVSFTLRKGQTVSQVGESGSGKSVTARAVMRLLSKGASVSPRTEVPYAGRNMAPLLPAEMRALRGKRLSMIFHEPTPSLNPVHTIGKRIAEAMRIHNRMSKADAKVRTLTLFKDVRIPDPKARLNQYPNQLPGGQRQHLATAPESEFIQLNGATFALDLSVRARIIGLLRKLQRNKGPSYLFVSHDLKGVRTLCHRVIVMQHGSTFEQGPVGVALNTPTTYNTRRPVKAAFEIAA